MIRIYKLKYETREAAIADLQEKEILDSNEKFSMPVHAVVELPPLEDVPATYDKNGNAITETTYLDGFHFDVMIAKICYFAENRVTKIKKPRHEFQQ